MFKASPVVPVRLEAEDMTWVWDDDQKVVLSQEAPNEIRILEKDIRIGSSIFVLADSNELTFNVRARVVRNRLGRALVYPKMTLYLDRKAIGEWQVESVIEQGQIQANYQDYSTVLFVDEGVHRIELAMTYEYLGSDWDLMVDFIDVNASPTEDPSVEGFETRDFSRLDWTSYGYSDWMVRSEEHHSGTYSAGAGSIVDNESSTLEVTLDCIDGDVTFFYKVSSESRWDWLVFSIDGVEVDKWSGEHDWTEVSFPVRSGHRTFRWTYSKDESTSDGSDMAWIDDITFSIND